MIANRMKTVLLATLAAAFASAACARDHGPQPEAFGSGHDGYNSGYNHHGRRGQLKLFSDQRLGGASRVVTATQNVPADGGSVVSPGSFGTVSGSTFFYVDGDRTVYSTFATPVSGRPRLAPKAKVIDVTEELVEGSFKPVNGCSYEMGVCVIRGK